MQKPIVIQGRTLTLSNGVPSTLTFALGAATDTAALRTGGAAGKALLIDRIVATVSASGTFVAGVSTFTGSGTGSIVATTPRVECEGKPLLTEGDSVTVTCSGTVTTTASGATAPGNAKVDVTITDGVQKSVDANKS